MKWIKSQWLNAISLLADFGFFLLRFNLKFRRPQTNKKNSIHIEFSDISHDTMGVECLYLGLFMEQHNMHTHTNTYTRAEECIIESDSPFIYMEFYKKKSKKKKIKYTIIDFALITINLNGIWNSQFFHIIIINSLLYKISGGGKNVYFFTSFNNIL